MKKLRVGIIGCGGISATHVDGYKNISDRVEIVAACDIDEEKLHRYGKTHDIPHLYTDYNEMMAKEDLDCVSVTTWNAAHKGATIAALRGGANVICEKPMAMNAAEAQEMLNVSRETGKLLQIGFIRRFGEDADLIRRFSTDGLLGDVYYGKASYLRKNGCPGGWFGDKRFSGGGPLIDLGVHVIDLARYLAGSPKPVSAYGVTYDNLGCNRASGADKAWGVESHSDYEYSVEDFASALIRFDNGFTLSVEASFNLNVDRDCGNIQLYGTKAGADVNTGELYTDLAGRFVKVTTDNAQPFQFTASMRREIAGFIDACAGKAPCRATAEDGVWLMKILDAIYESARTGKSVDIEPLH